MPNVGISKATSRIFGSSCCKLWSSARASEQRQFLRRFSNLPRIEVTTQFGVCFSQFKMMILNENRSRNFVRNGDGSSSVRLRRRKDQIVMQQHQNVQPNYGAQPHQIEVSKKRNRHSGDFYAWNSNSNPNNIVIPANSANPNRYSMIENRLALIVDPDRSTMETLDRKIPDEVMSRSSNNNPISNSELWRNPEVVMFRRRHLPTLSRPPTSGTGIRGGAETDIESSSNKKRGFRRSCDLSNSTGILIDNNDDNKTDVNRNVTEKSRNASSQQPKLTKKYHKRVSFFLIIKRF
jgi:hypothetical protein